MISERTKALLSAAAAIYGALWVPGRYTDGGDFVEGHHALAVEDAARDAYALLAAIEQREKQNAPTSKPLPCRHERLDAENCPWCRGSL